MQYPTILPISPEIVEVPGLELSEVELLVITAQGRWGNESNTTNQGVSLMREKKPNKIAPHCHRQHANTEHGLLIRCKQWPSGFVTEYVCVPNL